MASRESQDTMQEHRRHKNTCRPGRIVPAAHKDKLEVFERCCYTEKTYFGRHGSTQVDTHTPSERASWKASCEGLKIPTFLLNLQRRPDRLQRSSATWGILGVPGGWSKLWQTVFVVFGGFVFVLIGLVCRDCWVHWVTLAWFWVH